MDTSEQMGVAAGSHVRRQRRSVEEKRRIVEPGASVARVAQRHAINANQILAWRKKYREGRLGSRATAKLLTVAITDEWLSEAEKVGVPVPPAPLEIAGTAFDVARRDRLAAAGAHADSADGM